jgi:hypothetical protein
MRGNRARRDLPEAVPRRIPSGDFMKRHFFVPGALAFCALAQGRPMIIQEAQWLRAPDTGLSHFAESVAVDGDWALATALRSPDGSFSYPYQQLALLYRREGGTWTFDRILVDDETDEASWNYPSVAMKDGLAAVSTSPLRAFRLDGGSWTETPRPLPAPAGDSRWANGLTRIAGPTLAAVTGRCSHAVGTADLVAGTWNAPQFVTGSARSCDIANDSASIDVSGNTLVFTNPQEDTVYPPSRTLIHTRGGPGQPWQLEQTLPVGEWGRGVALLGDDLVVGDASPLGNPVFRRRGGAWEAAGTLPTLLGYSRYYDGAYHIARGGDLVLFSAPTFEDLPGAIAVYRRNAEGGYEHVALLVARTGDWLGGIVDISGRTVVAGGYRPDAAGEGRLYFFELPEDFTVPALVQDDFEDGDAAGWQPVAGNFDVVRRGVSQVLRQSDSSGSGSVVLTDSNFTNESITVDIRVRNFEGEDRWVGVASRYRDAENHYYLTLRNSGTVQLRRVRGGQITVLASRPLPIVENGSYRVRLESIGSRHRVFVNGVPQLSVVDPVFGRGRVALMSYGAAADFDNVIVTPGPRLTMFDNDIGNGGDCERFVNEDRLQVSGNPSWDCSVYERPFLRQGSLAVTARAAIGPSTGDQIVESRVQVEEFATNGSGSPWIGVMTRHVDGDNHYVLALERSNEVSLSKLVDGALIELERVPISLVPGAWYRLRLEAVGDQLRGYVNHILYVQATDRSHPRGNSGIATSRTAARFDYLRVFEP